jgi:hypothetical protein
MPIDSNLINPNPKPIDVKSIFEKSKAESLLAGGMYGTPDDPQSASPYLTQYLLPKKQEYTQSEIAKAAWERENEIGSFIARQQSGIMLNNDAEDGFDIIDYINNEVDGTDYAPYSENFLQFKNRRNAELYKKHLDKEFKNTEILQNSGWNGVAWGIGASLLSPVNLIPIGGGAYKAYKAGQLAKGIALTAGAGAVSMAGSEALLQSTQETRSLGESVLNVGAGTLLAGVLGGASATLSKKKFNKLAKTVENDIQIDKAEVRLNPETQNLEIKPDSVGAASKTQYEPIRKQYDEVYLPELKARGETPLPFKDYLKQQTALVPTVITDIAKLIKIDKLTNKIKLVNNLNPIQRLTRTEYAVKPREFAEKLMKTGMYTNKNLEGIANAQSAEISKKALLAPYNHNYKPIENNAYKEFKKRVKETGGNPIDQTIKNDIQFAEAVSRAMKNKDFSGIPEVDNFAKIARANVFNHLGQEAINVGIFKEGILEKAPKTALSYFPRMWNKIKVIAKENELRTFLNDKIKNVLLPQIKNAELNKEKILNSRIIDLQTQKIELEDKLTKASQEKLKVDNVTDATINEIDIPAEYKDIFKIAIDDAIQYRLDLEDFVDALNEKLPDSFDFSFDKIEKVYNNYVKSGKSVFNDEELIGYLNRYKEAVKTYKNINPKSLFSFLRDRGGISGDRGELANMGITHKTLPGLIRKQGTKGSTDIDYAREAAWEAGYFSDFPADGSAGMPTLNDFLQLMEREARGEKVYSSADIDKVMQKEAADNLITDLEQLGIDFNKIEEAVKLKNGKIKKQIEIKTENASKVIDTKTFIKIDKLLAKTEIELMNKKINTLKNQYTAKQIENSSKWAEISDENDYVNGIVDDIVFKLKGEDRLGLINDTDIKIEKRGPLKERTLNFVRDEELEPWLENDARKVIDFYANTVATDIEIARAFDGDLTLSNAIEDISKEYDDIIFKTTDEKELKKINKEKQTAINDIDSVAKIMRGMYARPDNPDSMIVRGGRIARQYNYLTKMGQVVVASISDIARPIAKHGLKTWARYLPDLIANTKGVKLNIKEAKLGGNITDIVAPERMASFSGLHDPYASSASTFERYINNVSTLMSKTNLMPVWNDFHKGWASVFSQQRMIKAINKYETLKTNDISYLAQIGIGKDDIPAFKEQLKKYSYKEGRLFVANTEKWDNKELIRKYYNALNTDIDSTIITMGAGDLPLSGNTEVGKLILQFKSFAFAATQQALMAGLQQKDLAVLSGLISSTTMGMMAYYLKKKMAGKEASDNPVVWLMEGWDRGGFGGITSDFSHIADKVGFGANSLLGVEQSSRYSTRNFAASLLGPTISLIDDWAVGTRALTSGEISPSDARAIRRMIFLNNHWLLTGAMDRLQENLANTE